MTCKIFTNQKFSLLFSKKKKSKNAQREEY